MPRKKSIDKEELKLKIIRTASEEFIRLGIRAVHMDSIAEKLSISKRTIYENFSDKEELMKAVFLDYRHQMMERMTEISKSTDNILEIIYTFYEIKINEMAGINPLYFRDLRKHPEVYAFMRDEHRQGHDAALQIFEKGKQQGVFREDVNYALLLQFMDMQMDLLVYSDISEKYPLADIFREFSNLNLRGIITEKGTKMMNELLKDKII